MQEIDRQVLEKYGLEINNIAPFRDGFVLNTDKGKKFLKKSRLKAERVLFIHSVKEHLYKNGFQCLDRYVCALEGKPYVSGEGYIYTVTDFIEGRECDFENKEDVAAASRLLAAMHRASKGYRHPEGSLPRDDLGKLPSYFSRRLDEIKRLKKIAKRGKSKFDYLFLEYVDYFYQLGEDSLRLLKSQTYCDLVEETRKKGYICHHDYAYHNLVQNEGRLFVTNFDFCCYEIKTYDIANFIRRKMRRCMWDIKEAADILSEYRKIEPLGDNDLYALKLMLQFPQKLWRVANKYYNSKRSWSERSFISKLQEVIDEMRYHKEFIDKFDTLV